MRDIARLKRSVDLRLLVAETHELDRSGKVSCPFHHDRHPSCHIYRDGFKCFACGVHGDHLDWLEQVHGLDPAAARERLEQLAGGSLPTRRAGRPSRGSRRAAAAGEGFSVVDDGALRAYRRRLAAMTRLPAALWRRGLTLDDARALGLAAVGDDALLPIFGPAGRILALKRRFHAPPAGAPRYTYTTAGHGSPAWCSPQLHRRPLILIIEGELNGMVSYLALREAGFRIGVMAPAGAAGPLHGQVLAGRELFLYADPDVAGARALERWRATAVRAGAASVTLLPRELFGFGGTEVAVQGAGANAPWDACDVAERCGRRQLARRLVRAIFLTPEAARGQLPQADRLGSDDERGGAGADDRGDGSLLPVLSG